MKHKFSIKISNNDLSAAPKKYCRLVLTEDSFERHTFIKNTDGQLEYHQGIGRAKEITARKFRTLLRTIIRTAKSHEITYLAVQFDTDFLSKLKAYDEEWLSSTIAENFVLASYEFKHYKTKTQNKVDLKEVLVCGNHTKASKASFHRGCVVGESANIARDIANTSACDMTPSQLANTTQKLFKGTKANVKILGEKKLKELKMGLLLAVGCGTELETKLIVIEYWGAGKPTNSKNSRPSVLLGKGITFDSGGLNVKPSGHMHDMHLDMSGGAVVIGALHAIASLELKKNVIAIIPAAENAISDKAMRAGDIVTAMNGSTVEVVHTDAEGRMVLADALTYSERYQPKEIIDVATLTGASLAALGQHASAVMSTNEQFQNTLCDLGELSGDYVWPLPLWDEYDEHIKSVRADIANIAPNFSRFGGAIEGGIFLKHFAPKNVKWAHIDIAPRMETISSDKLAKGSAGEPVRLLVRFIEST